MHAEIHRLLESDGVASRGQVLDRVTHHVLDHAIAAGALVRLHPGVFVRSGDASLPLTRRRAALRYAGAGSALSHVTALEMWTVTPPRDKIHIVVDRSRRIHASTGLVVHQRKAFAATAPGTVLRDGLATVRLERSLVDSWALLPPEAGRAAVIAAVQGRLTTAGRVRAALREVPNLPRRVALGRLLELLADGHHSELEIWGHRHVFDHPSLPRGLRQLPVRLPLGSCYLDLAYRTELVDVEMDGAAFHFAPGQRERDMRRDAALGALGWLVLRFSSSRLREDPDGVRRELRQVLDTRRRQLEPH